MLLKSLEIVFENDDAVVIDGLHIGMFALDGLATALVKNIECYQIESCGRCLLELHSDANQKHKPFGQDSIPVVDVFDRIMNGQDIYMITGTFITRDGETLCRPVSVPWSVKDEHRNMCQHMYKSTSGHLYLLIDEDEDAEISTFFDKQYIDNEEFIEPYFDNKMSEYAGMLLEYEECQGEEVDTPV